MRAFLYSILFAMASMSVLAQSDGTPTYRPSPFHAGILSKSEGHITILSYRHFYGGYQVLGVFSVAANSVDGVCKFTSVSSTGNGVGKSNGSLDAAVFAKLMDGAKALMAARDPAHSAPDTGKRYVIEVTIRDKDGSKFDKYVVPHEEASEAVRAWAKLFYDATVVRKVP